MAPLEKKQKTEEAKESDAMETPAAASAPEAPKVAEPPPELEKDAGAVKEALKEQVVFLPADTTLNVLPATTSGLLMSMTDGGLQGFIAGGRANVGVSKGRYLFEVKVVEITGQGVLRVGFSTAGSSLVLGGDKGGIGFDADGSTLADGKRTPNKQNLTRDCIVGVLLNLDAGSPNKNTISLFKDGKRMTQPVELPEDLHGKALFPHVSFKASTVYANFGPSTFAPLPFKCHMVQGAAHAHCTVTKHKGGKSEVQFPVSLPDEATFDWLDMYKEKHPYLTELSDRMIMDWAQQSGLLRHTNRLSNDKPEALQKVLDERALRRAVYSVAPLNPRSYIVMEVRGNLLQDERKELLDKFDGDLFKKVAVVVMGDAPAEFKKKTQSMTLAKKQAASDFQFRAKQAEEKRKKLAEKKKKDMEKARLKAIKVAQKKAKEIAKKAEAEKKAKAAAEAAAKDGEAKEGEVKEAAAKEEDKEKDESEAEEESADEEEPEEMEVDEEPPRVELDADEKKLAFFQHMVKDLTPSALSASFGKFSLPSVDEGFAEVTYFWSKEAACKTYLRNYILDKKLNLRVEELAPGAWSRKTMAEWSQVVKEWQTKLKVYDDKMAAKAKAKAQKAAQKAREAAIKAAKEKADAMKKEREQAEAAAKKAAAEASGEKAKEEEEPKKEDEDMKQDVEEKKEEEQEEDEEEEPFDFASLDVFGVDDLLDVGAGIPIFKEFKAADWAMMALRFELHLLAHAFRKDVDDPDRLGIHVDHIPFYYNKYFKRQLTPKDYGVETCTDLVKLVADAVYLAPQAVLQSQLSEEMETFAVFAKLTEDARRVRSLRIDLGEDDAKLNLSGRILSGDASREQRKGGKKGDAKGAMKGVVPAGWTNPKQWENDLQASFGQWNVKGGAKGQTGKMGKEAMKMGLFGKGGAGAGKIKGGPVPSAGIIGPNGATVTPPMLKRPDAAALLALPPMTNIPPAAPAPAPQLVAPPGAKGGFGGKDAGGWGGGKDWSKGGGKDWGMGGGKDWSKGGGKGGGKDQGWGSGGGKSWGKGGGKW